MTRSITVRARLLTAACILPAALLLMAMTTASQAQEPDLARARGLYQQTRYDEALKLLLPLTKPASAAYELIAKCYFMQEDFAKACDFFHRAVAGNPYSATAHDWLGRSYGRRAENANPLSAPGLARKALENFKKAVELDPQNLEAISDLFEYSLQAPGFLGGGIDQAEALAQRLAGLDQAEHHYALARLAETRKDLTTAEQHLRQCVQVAPRQPGRLIDLATFLAKQHRYAESDDLFRQTQVLAPDNPRLLIAWAKAMINAGRNLEIARQLLERFLLLPLTADDPPRSKAEQLLRQATKAG
jgi:tetratricopeptide (TPR) repeat protein